jgi:hypothetical protein
MPSYVARTFSSTKDGSQQGRWSSSQDQQGRWSGPTMAVITAPNAEAARQDAAAQLGVQPSMVIIEPI